MKHCSFQVLSTIFVHLALLGIVYMLNAGGLTAPAVSFEWICVHIVLSAVFCVICMSQWVGFAATVAMTLVLWLHPLSDIWEVLSIDMLVGHWKLIALMIALSVAYSCASYYHAPKFFAAIRNMAFPLILLVVVILPAFGINVMMV